MWCVASAPIVPLARDLDAALGTQLSELAVHFRKLSTPLPTAPPPLGLHPRFFRKVLCRFLAPLLYLEPHPHFLHKVLCRSYSPQACLHAFPHLRHFPPRSTPLPPHGHRCNGTFLPKTQKNEHRSLGSGARFGLLSGRHSAEWC